MLPIPRLRYLAPRRLVEALGLLEQGSRGRTVADGDGAARRGPVVPIAGGTDLVPNLKHRLLDVELLVDLTRLEEDHLRGVREVAGRIHLGALTSLAAAAADPLLRARHPALAGTYRQIGSPQLRNMGTVGGNLCLDTRCSYVNQTAFWRAALGHCLKRKGTTCHVVPGGTRCVAACSSDGAALLTALGAEARVERGGGDRWVAVEALLLHEGLRHLALAPGELITELRLPAAPPGRRAAYQKLRARQAIDFPQLSVAAVADLEPSGACRSLRVVVSALGARPRLVAGLGALVEGRPLDDAALERVAAEAHRQCHPLANISADPAWRREMVPVLVRRALRRALGEPG
jgi:4-hydroxybenzoyl-CoA reductase subunit beta